LSSELSELPPTARRDGTRGRILVAALTLFADHGFEGTSIRDIASGTGLNSATLYSHFESKAAVLAELVRVGHEEHHGQVVRALLRSGTDPRDQLAAFVRAHVLTHCAYPRLAVVANAELHALSPLAAAPSVVLRDQSSAMLLDVLRRGEAQAVFALVHVEATAAAIGAMGMQVAHWYPSPVVGLDAEQLGDVFADLALRMAGTTSSDEHPA
jgi:AcrR family transcriptional regulator